jgi:ketosteroid isomerase-like protein
MPVRLQLIASSLFLATVSAAPVFAQSAATPATQPLAVAAQASPDADAVAQVVDTFMTDIAGGQFESARQLMTPDAVVLANGQVLGDRDGYINGPAKGDAAALRATTQRELLHRNAKADAGHGWVVSEKRLRSTIAGAQAPREILVTETMLLARTGGGWKITHIHWSTRQAG